MHVSIIIPALDEADSIGGCLTSLTAQTRDGDEILVLDNGSTDDTAAIAAEFDQVTVLDVPDERLPGDQHFRGLAELRQFGAMRASNPIVATTDADTLPPAGWIDRIRAHFEDDPDLSVVWGVVVDRNGVPVRQLTGKYLTFLGGVSGANTAFRKAHFDRLERGYVGWPMFEDVTLISRMARTGKAVHDTDMLMVSDLDRRRYQTIPLLAGAGVGAVAGALVGGPVGAFALGSAGALAVTELTYEGFTDTQFHHDQMGLMGILGGAVLGGPVGAGVGGVGAGVLSHHVLTEGVSGVPTTANRDTEVVCHIPTDGGMTEIRCEPWTTDTDGLTRILAGVTVGAVAGVGIGWLAA